MITSLLQYLREEALPRTADIFKGSEFWIAVIVGALCGIWGHLVIPPTTKVSDVCVALLTYAAIALGFSLAGLTLVLTLPNPNFVKELANTRPEKSKHDSYTNLLFVFTWTAFAHWILILMSVVLLVISGSNLPVLPMIYTRHQIMTGILAALSVYCLLQFLITLFTLSQVGRVNITLIRPRKDGC